MDPPAYGSPYPAEPPKVEAAGGAACWSTVGWAGADVKTGASSQVGSRDGDGGNLICVIGTPWWEAAADGGGAGGAAGGGDGGAAVPGIDGNGA
jgi:hypothetical protein